MRVNGPRPLAEAELAALRAEMCAAGLRMRARLGFTGLIRTRLLDREGRSPKHPTHREFADELAFLSLTLHGDSVAEVRFGVRHRRGRHTTGVLLSRWKGTRFAAGAEIRVCLHGVSCTLADLWDEFDHLRYIDLPPIHPQAWRELY
ncbi:hypothetical protein J7431_01470 [Xanthomonas phaseoli pv. dieffenbachiae]|uniref:hypothetical protein n=2 Tax=Xanthomonas TaxID=338 RepID=UPI0006E7026C|nr:hypothetical protein [Xanthomonas phaseoli pv. dieffenbachiae]MBO9751814.1 hypothetical protein [Xanthomonas phaseoli pv. dieffenbachiae]MBO9888956.1 hypothetical protein [Xanthomonas sp. D-36-1]OQP83410.1 hypothetical protein IB69_000110 [Xanthomonas citri]